MDFVSRMTAYTADSWMKDGARSSASVLPGSGWSSWRLEVTARASSPPPPSARHTVENGKWILKSVDVDVNSKTAYDARARWLSMFDVAVDVNVVVDGDVHVHVLVHVHVHVHVDEDVDVDAHVDVAVAENETEHVCSYL